jgi:hypothetical protein
MSTQPDPAAVQEMIDKMAIGELQSRYMYALDWYDADMYASVFTEDGVLEWPEGNCKGRKAIHEACVRIGAFYNKLATGSAPTKAAHKRHFLTNRMITVSGDRAQAVSYWFDLFNDNMGRIPYVPAYGHYQDELIRTAEGWRFTSRKIFNEISSTSSKENPARF